MKLLIEERFLEKYSNLYNALDELTDLEKQIIVLRYGLENGKTMKLVEISRSIDVSYYRISKIIKRTLPKIREYI